MYGMSDSPTPETDNALHGVWYRGNHGSSIPALCRRLECERNDARHALAALRTVIESAAITEHVPMSILKAARA